MSEEITVERLKALMVENNLKQKDIGILLNLTHPKVSAMMSGTRKISDSEQKLLKLYFYNEMPFELIRDEDDFSSILKFTHDEWRVITVLATREGFVNTRSWITAKIRGFLENNDRATEIAKEQKRQESKITSISENPDLPANGDLHVASDVTPYTTKEKQAEPEDSPNE